MTAARYNPDTDLISISIGQVEIAALPPHETSMLINQLMCCVHESKQSKPNSERNQALALRQAERAARYRARTPLMRQLADEPPA